MVVKCKIDSNFSVFQRFLVFDLARFIIEKVCLQTYVDAKRLSPFVTVPDNFVKSKLSFVYYSCVSAVVWADKEIPINSVLTLKSSVV